MLGGLFKAGWQSESPDKRCFAIKKMAANDANQSIFQALAINDPSQKVRLACIEQINNAGVLFEVFQQSGDETSKSVAKTAFCKLIGPSSLLDQAEFEALIAEHDDVKDLVIQHCPHPKLRVELIETLTQPELASIVADVAYAETRHYIAQQLNQLNSLELARKKLKGKDKKAEKIIRTKLEDYRSQHKLENSVHSVAISLCEQMEFIASHPEWRSEFKDKYHLYSERWSALQLKPIDLLVTRFDNAADVAASKVEVQIAHESEEQKQLQIADKLVRYGHTLAPLCLSELADEHLSINTVLGEAIAVWRKSADVVSPDSSLVITFLSAQQALSTLSDLIECLSAITVLPASLRSALQAIEWPSDYPELIGKQEANILLAQIEQQQSEQKQQYKQDLDTLHKRINRLLGTSKKGDIKRARHELSATTKAASNYHGKDRKVLDERLEMAAEIVSKMNDWQNFATEPKLIDLCSAMEALVNSSFHPDKLAQKISKLQNDWKTLGNTDVSNEHWQRFKAAADLAYEPCANFFKQRRETQANNLAKREPLVEEMTSVLDETDWHNSPNYKRIETRLREINTKWRKIKDVEHKAGQQQWDQLSTIREKIYHYLDPVYDSNIELKNQITAQTEALIEQDISEASLEKLKLYQNRWKQIGITRRNQDQQAWTAFRAASDRVFDKVKQLRYEKRAAEEQQLSAYKDIIQQIISLSNSAANLSDAEPEFEQLCGSYNALPILPKGLPDKLIERLAADFKRATERYSKTRERLIQASKDDVVNSLSRKAQLCTQLELSVSRADSEKASALEQQINSIIIVDKALEKRFIERLNQVANNDRLKANEARRRLCIDLEILLDVPSPDEDKALRMKIQLDRMKKAGIGHTQVERTKALAELKLAWLCSPGADPDLQGILEKRFNHLMSAS